MDGGGIEVFLWYGRHELRVAARRQKLVHRSSVAQTVAPFILCHQIPIITATRQINALRGSVSQFFLDGWAFQHHVRIEIVQSAGFFRLSPEVYTMTIL